MYAAGRPVAAVVALAICSTSSARAEPSARRYEFPAAGLAATLDQIAGASLVDDPARVGVLVTAAVRRSGTPD
jgi:hypothetical protein